MGSSLGDAGITIGNPGFLRWFRNYYHYYGDEPVSKQQKKSLTLLSAAVGLALTLGSSAAVADVIEDTSANAAACADAKDSTACIGAWDLGNVVVDIFNLSTGVVFGTMDPTSGVYPPMVVGDSFVSKIYDDSQTDITAKLSGKVWPVGEPTGIRAVNGDTSDPANCLINTAYILGSYISDTTPQQVTCSSGFQTHKRFKIAMQPPTVDSSTYTAAKPIDLVFNVSNTNTAVIPYQVFSKINNYTGVRLEGYKIQVGTGTGAGFVAATNGPASGQLYISLGQNEATSGGSADLFDMTNGLANFSHGLFGPIDAPHFPDAGFFSNLRAYYPVTPSCDIGTCPAVATGVLKGYDTLTANGGLTANYTHLFGKWLPSKWQPEGIFWDDDKDPTTDAKLVAWWNGSEWQMPERDPVTGKQTYDANGYAVFVPVPASQLAAWASDKYYAEAGIEDVLNLGLNYILHVGDVTPTSSTVTVRITPIPAPAVDQTTPAWIANPAPALSTYVPSTTSTATTTSSGGGCTVGGDGRFDPIFPALLLAGLGFLGLRRFSRKS